MLKRIARWILRNEINALSCEIDELKERYSNCAAGPWEEVPFGDYKYMKRRLLVCDGFDTTIAIPQDVASWKGRVNYIRHVAVIRTPHDCKRNVYLNQPEAEKCGH